MPLLGLSKIISRNKFWPPKYPETPLGGRGLGGKSGKNGKTPTLVFLVPFLLDLPHNPRPLRGVSGYLGGQNLFPGMVLDSPSKVYHIATPQHAPNRPGFYDQFWVWAKIQSWDPKSRAGPGLDFAPLLRSFGDFEGFLATFTGRATPKMNEQIQIFNFWGCTACESD